MYPIPENETDRLRALKSCDYLYSDDDDAFKVITRLLQRWFEVDYAFVTVVEGERQWCKAATGIKVGRMNRDIAFCAHTIMQREVLCIPDAKRDKTFCDNPLVTGPPHLRFYAGAPIVLNREHAIGAICVADTRPRAALTTTETAFLATAAEIVRDLIEHRMPELSYDPSRKTLS